MVVIIAVIIDDVVLLISLFVKRVEWLPDELLFIFFTVLFLFLVI